MNWELQINLFSQCNLMYSILGIDKPCIFLFRTTQFIISSDFPTRICCILFQIEFLSIVKLDMLFNENERKICILKIYTEIWAFLDEVWSQLKQNWYMFCFENCSDLFWEEIVFRDWKNFRFEDEGQDFTSFLRYQKEQFVGTVKGQSSSWNKILFKLQNNQNANWDK